MEKPLRNLINMIRATLTYCGNNTSATAGITAFAGAKTTADNKLVLIDGLNQIAEGTSKGVTLDTTALQAAMISIGRKCGNAVAAYAASVSNNTLRVKVSYTKSQFNRFPKDEIDDICQTIHDEADANVAAAAAFGYDATDVTDLQTAIDLYRTSVQNPRQSIISKTQAIASMKTLAREIVDNSFVLIMDKMVQTLETTNLTFVTGYFQAREKIDLGSTHAKVRGYVRNNVTAPLQGVTFTIRKAGTTEVVKEVNTNEIGYFAASPLLPGDYDFIFRFSGYQTIIEENVHIAAGKELRRKITMLVVPLQQITLNPGQVKILATDVDPDDPRTAYVKNASPGGVNINIYYGSTGSTPYSGTGITLASDQEQTIDVNAPGPVQQYLLAQNASPFSGILQFKALS